MKNNNLKPIRVEIPEPTKSKLLQDANKMYMTPTRYICFLIDVINIQNPYIDQGAINIDAPGISVKNDTYSMNNELQRCYRKIEKLENFIKQLYGQGDKTNIEKTNKEMIRNENTLCKCGNNKMSNKDFCSHCEMIEYMKINPIDSDELKSLAKESNIISDYVRTKKIY